jgi:RNA polymerase sigma-70 factor (ECF subfamily)
MTSPLNAPPVGAPGYTTARRLDHDDDDLQLSRRVASGDIAAFERMLRRFNKSLYRVARAIVKDDAEAEDVLQDAMLRAYRSMSAFRGDARLSTWLVRIVANEALGRLRQRSRRGAVVPLHPDADLEEFDLPTDAAQSVPLSVRQDPEREAMRVEMRRLLESRIDALPDAFRVVFVLRALEDLNVEETADCLGIPPATVRTRFFRAKSLLREALSREIDRAYEDAFEFGGHRCDRITAAVLARIAAANAPPG